MPDVNAFTWMRVDQLPERVPPVDVEVESMTGVERDIGQLVEAVRTLKELASKLESENESLRKELHDFKSEIRGIMAEIRGGQKVLRFLGWIGAGLIGGLVASVKAWWPIVMAILPR